MTPEQRHRDCKRRDTLFRESAGGQSRLNIRLHEDGEVCGNWMSESHTNLASGPQEDALGAYSFGQTEVTSILTDTLITSRAASHSLFLEDKTFYGDKGLLLCRNPQRVRTALPLAGD